MEKKQSGIEEEEEITFSLPDVIEEEILLRLPTKSLIQFKLVSKPWKTRITSSQFARKHLKNQTQTNNKNLNLMLHGSGGPLHSVSCNNYDDINEKLIPHNQPLLPDFVNHQKHRFHILGSCDGLLLVVVTTTLNGDYAIYIWNPTTGEYKILPQLKPYMDESYVYGFGRDLSTDNDNYKVLLLETDFEDPKLETLELKVNMYTTHTNSWKTILSNIPITHSGRATLEGMILAYNYLNYLTEIDEPSIISLDLKDDKFREIRLPIAPGILVISLCNLNGDLCALTIGHDFNLYDLWKMENFGVKEQESWTKLFSIDSPVIMDKPIGCESPLHVLDNGQILLSAHYRYQKAINPTFVVCYCTEEKKASLFVQGNEPYRWSIPVVYQESLISPNAAFTVEEELPRELKRRRTHWSGNTDPSAPPVEVELLGSSSSCSNYYICLS